MLFQQFYILWCPQVTPEGKSMKILNLDCKVKQQLSCGICLLSLLLPVTIVQKYSEAQTPNSVWKRLEVADSRISASQITWLRTTTVAPSSLQEQDIQKFTAQITESSNQQGKEHNLTDEQIEAITKKSIANFLRRMKGVTKTNTMAFWHHEQTTRCDVFTEEKKYFAIDYYDGTNIVALIGFDKDPSSGVKPNQGTLVRGEEPLSYSATRPGDLLFMVGQPVTQVFHPEDSKLQQNSDGSVTLEKTQRWQDMDCLLRLRLSKEGLRPLSLDCIIKDTSALLLRWSAGTKKSYLGGISFPETFKVEAFNGAQQVTLTEDYTIVKAAFNKAADLTELRVPPGSAIGDMRFGQDNVASYTLNTKGILPTDEKVKDLLLKQGRPVDSAIAKSDAVPQDADTPQTAPKTLAATNPYSAASFSLGALFILGGCFLWKRSSSGESKDE